VRTLSIVGSDGGQKVSNQTAADLDSINAGWIIAPDVLASMHC
jgi:hypothetical protein